MSEAVNHPQHYQKEGRKECIKEMEEKFGTYQTCIFALCSAYKYVYRAGEKAKNSVEQDLAKAQWYLDFVGNYKARSLDIFDKTRLISYLSIVEDELKKVRKQNAES